MKFPQPLVQARFLEREKRFLIHAQLPDGSRVVAHTNNTGRMTSCLNPGCRVWLSPADNPRRKLKWTLEITETMADPATGTPGGILVGVNTALANRLAGEALAAELLPRLQGFSRIRPEVPFGTRGSRADFLLQGQPGHPDRRCWLEVKNVSLVTGGHARFPDAPSERARKHLRELAEVVERGDRGALFFCVQRADALSIGPADDIDPEYGRMLRRAAAGGVEIHAAVCAVDLQGIAVASSLPVLL